MKLGHDAQSRMVATVRGCGDCPFLVDKCASFTRGECSLTKEYVPNSRTPKNCPLRAGDVLVRLGGKR